MPAIPLTTITSSQQEEQRETTFQTWSSTSFDDDGHYTDIHWNVGGGETTRIPTWRQSFVDETGHYNYLEFDQPTVTGDDRAATEEQRPRSSGRGYEGLDPAELATLRRPPAPHHYVGIGSGHPRSINAADQEPGEQSRHGSHTILEESSERRDLGALGSEDSAGHRSQQRQREGDRQGYEGLDPSIVQELRRRRRRHSYAGVNNRSGIHRYLEVIGYSRTNNPDDPGATAQSYDGLDPSVVEELRRPRRRSYAGISATDRSGVHSYLEVAGYSGTNNRGGPKVTAQSYEGLDPAEVEEFRRRKPHDYSRLTDGRGARQGEVMEREGYEGLDPVELEEFRQRSRRPREYVGLTQNVEDFIQSSD